MELMEMIYGTRFATPLQCEAVAILHGRQIAKKFEEKRAYSRSLEYGGLMKTIWHFVVENV